MGAQDEKIINIGRLVKLLQSFSEAQEEDVSNLKLTVRNLSLRVEEMLAGTPNLTGHNPGFFVAQ